MRPGMYESGKCQNEPDAGVQRKSEHKKCQNEPVYSSAASIEPHRGNGGVRRRKQAAFLSKRTPIHSRLASRAGMGISREG
jgi:hypothetical protein